MKDAVPGRELFTLEAIGVKVQGTFHLPRGHGSNVAPASHVNTGVLVLCGLLAPRAGIGDSAVYWAESLAGAGYPCFRVDLPASCDSVGNPPPAFMSFIDDGGYEAVGVAIVRQLRSRYNLSSLVIVGHCSGAVTALFAAAASKDCAGLVLLEPYFHLQPPIATKKREALSNWAKRNRLGGLLSNAYDLFKAMRLRLRTNQLPGNANFGLLKRWKNLASAGLPILVIKAPGPKASGAKPRLGEFDYMEYILRVAGKRSRVDIQVIEGADHSFANRIGRAGVRRQIEGWFATYFPQTPGGQLSQNTGQPVATGAKKKLEGPEPVFAQIDCALEI